MPSLPPPPVKLISLPFPTHPRVVSFVAIAAEQWQTTQPAAWHEIVNQSTDRSISALKIGLSSAGSSSMMLHALRAELLRSYLTYIRNT